VQRVSVEAGLEIDSVLRVSRSGLVDGGSFVVQDSASIQRCTQGSLIGDALEFYDGGKNQALRFSYQQPAAKARRPRDIRRDGGAISMPDAGLDRSCDTYGNRPS